MKQKIRAGMYARKLIHSRWDGEARTYLQLNKPCRRALDVYMGEGWPTKAWRMKFKFGLIRMGMKQFTDYVMASPDLKESEGKFKSWGAYHSWYMGIVSHEAHGASDLVEEVWPVLLGESAGEAIQDGWHRLHYYYEHGIRVVPALFYIQCKRINWMKEAG